MVFIFARLFEIVSTRICCAVIPVAAIFNARMSNPPAKSTHQRLERTAHPFVFGFKKTLTQLIGALDVHQPRHLLDRVHIRSFEKAVNDHRLIYRDNVALGAELRAAFAQKGLRINLNAIVDPDAGGQSWRLRTGLGAATPGDPGDATQLRAFGAILSEARPIPGSIFGSGNMRAADLTEALLSKTGADAHTANQRLVFANSSLLEMTKIEAEQGVDTDQELQRLMQIEQIYAANARLISVVDELMDTLLRL